MVAVALTAVCACTFDKSGVAPEELDQPDASSLPVGDAGPDSPDARTDPSSADAGPQSCTASQMMCNDSCRNITHDPRNCGGCGVRCSDDEYCSDSMCVCRPGLVPEMGGNNCVDTNSDPDACGPSQESCGGRDDRCEDGSCTNKCSGGRTDCDHACVDTDSDPLNCGACGADCHENEICVNGSCRDFDAEPACNGCPCSACGGGEACSQYPGDSTLTICVD
jgi:hypothetical protein